MKRRSLSKTRTGIAVLSLVLSTAVCLALLLVRDWSEHGRRLNVDRFGFVPKNLLLAWIPLLCAVTVHTLQLRGWRWNGLLAGCAVIWFLFFPNAPYLITDLVHFHWGGSQNAWFDLLLIMSVAWTGLFAGYFSLYLMQEMVRGWRGRAMGWLFAAAMLALGSIGVYVGRFWRWNSRDALFRPIDLASNAVSHVRMPPGEGGLTFIAAFFVFSLLTYATFFAFANLHAAPPEKQVAGEGVLS